MKAVLFLLFGLLSLSASMLAHGATIAETLALCKCEGGGKGDFVFDIRRAAKAVEPVLRACGW